MDNGNQNQMILLRNLLNAVENSNSSTAKILSSMQCQRSRPKTPIKRSDKPKPSRKPNSMACKDGDKPTTPVTRSRTKACGNRVCKPIDRPTTPVTPSGKTRASAFRNSMMHKESDQPTTPVTPSGKTRTSAVRNSTISKQSVQQTTPVKSTKRTLRSSKEDDNQIKLPRKVLDKPKTPQTSSDSSKTSACHFIPNGTIRQLQDNKPTIPPTPSDKLRTADSVLRKLADERVMPETISDVSKSSVFRFIANSAMHQIGDKPMTPSDKSRTSTYSRIADNVLRQLDDKLTTPLTLSDTPSSSVFQIGSRAGDKTTPLPPPDESLIPAFRIANSVVTYQGYKSAKQLRGQRSLSGGSQKRGSTAHQNVDNKSSSELHEEVLEFPEFTRIYHSSDPNQGSKSYVIKNENDRPWEDAILDLTPIMSRTTSPDPWKIRSKYVKWENSLETNVQGLNYSNPLRNLSPNVDFHTRDFNPKIWDKVQKSLCSKDSPTTPIYVSFESKTS